MVGKASKKEYVIIETIVTLEQGTLNIDEVCRVTQKSSNLSQAFKKILINDYAVKEAELW